MKRIELIFFVIGICFVVSSFIINIWWNANAPYCCVNSCCCTVSTTDCLPNILIVILGIVGMCFFLAGSYGILRNGT